MDFKLKQKLCAQYRRELKNRINKYEQIILDILTKHNIHFMYQKGFIAGDNFVIADFYLPRPLKTIIEVDGPYHLTEKQMKRDINKDEYYHQRKFKVIRLTHEQIDCLDENILITQILG